MLNEAPKRTIKHFLLGKNEIQMISCMIMAISSPGSIIYSFDYTDLLDTFRMYYGGDLTDKICGEIMDGDICASGR